MLALVQTGITYIQIDVDKVYDYLDTLVTHTVFPLLQPPSILWKILETVKRVMAQHPHLALPNSPDKDIWN